LRRGKIVILEIARLEFNAAKIKPPFDPKDSHEGLIL
jgi:hypothetical protein